MTDYNRDQSIRALSKVVLEVQVWAAALKEILISRGLTTDEEFARYVAAAEHPEHRNGTESGPMDPPLDLDGPKQ